MIRSQTHRLMPLRNAQLHARSQATKSRKIDVARAQLGVDKGEPEPKGSRSNARLDAPSTHQPASGAQLTIVCNNLSSTLKPEAQPCISFLCYSIL